MKKPTENKHTDTSIIRMLGLTAAIAFVTLGPLVACQKAEWREVKATNTGDPTIEAQRGDLNPAAAQPGQTAYVAPDRLRGRSTPDQNPEEATQLLERGDQVQIVDPTPVGEDRLVSVRIVEQEPDVPMVGEQLPAATPAPVAQEITYVPAEYLQTTPVVRSQPVLDADRYIVIQNIATEKLRVYEVGTAGQPNRLVLEADMIAGENNPGKTRRTALGSYKIVSWHKFYQDSAGLFPSWYDSQSPSLPLPGASLQDWTQKYFLPKGNSGLVRGAFGWYTAKLGPNAFAQWTHGTLGWGADRDRFIQLPKSQLAQYYSDPRSFGCTRVENQAIAYLQDLLPVGTKVIKIYAKESARDQTATEGAPTTWEWILTKDGVRSVNPNSSARAAQLLRDVPSEQVLEQGVYKIDTTPNAVPFKKEVKGDRLSAVIIRPEANLYDLKESSFRGVFLVDEGRLVGYSHPKELRKGGYTDHLLPRAILK
ncbi:MAG: L,D-transpeptidase family protein [Bdellovibrionales bacterium]|nr:L,D-transpeptidase family protein [Bdellovibrionales bacterium]